MNKATKTVVRAFGMALAITGAEHGIGEIVQGNITTNGAFIRSWGDVEPFRVLAGEPAMTIVPNMLVSGVLSIALSCLIALWCLRFLEKRYSGLMLLVFSILLLLVGGGFGPPLIGIIIGLAGLKLRSRFTMLRSLRQGPVYRALARVWPFSLTLGLLCFFYLFPVSILLSAAFGIFNEASIVSLSLLAFFLVFVSIVSAYLYDARNRSDSPKLKDRL